MFGQGGYGSEIRQAPHPPPSYQQPRSMLPPPPPPPPLYQQGPAPTRPFFQQGSVPPPAFQNSPSLAQPPFQQPLAIPPPPPPIRPPPPPPPPALGVQPGQPHQISHPYQYAHEHPNIQPTVQQPSAGNTGRPYLPPPPPPPSTYGNSTLVHVNQPQASSVSSNPILVPNQNMHLVPPYQHPGVRPLSFQPSQGQGLLVPGIQHFPLPPHPAPNVVSPIPASFTAFVQGTTHDSQPPSSPPPPPPPLPSSPPPLPSSPPPDAGMPSVDTFVDIISEDGHIDAALPTSGDTFDGEAGHSHKVLVTSVGEETSPVVKPGEDVQNESPPLQLEQSLQIHLDVPAKLNDSDMDMEDDGDFSEPDIEPKYGELDDMFQASPAINNKLVDENAKLLIPDRDVSQDQLNHLVATVEADDHAIEVKASESENQANNLMAIQSAGQENKNAFVHRMNITNGSPLRQIQDYASDENTDDENPILDFTPARTAVEAEPFSPVLKDESSPMQSSIDQVNVNFGNVSQALNVPTVNFGIESLASTETLPSEETSLAPVYVKSVNAASSTVIEISETGDFINHEQDDRTPDKKIRNVDATNASPKHANLENAVGISTTCQVVSSLSEDKKPDFMVQKVDEFGRMVREGVSESDSESDDMRYNERYAKRRSRSSLEVRRRRSRSPWHRADKRSRSPSWSPRRERSRSRSPASSRRVGESARLGRGHPPPCFNFLRGRCRHGSSCRYLHSDSIQNRTKPQHYRVFSNNSDKYETQKGMENIAQETTTGQEYYSSPDIHTHDTQFCKDDSFEKKLVHTSYREDNGATVASPGSMEVDHDSLEITAVEPKEEQGRHHSPEESGRKSVEQQPSPPRISSDEATPSLGELPANQLAAHIISQNPQGTSVLESLHAPDTNTDTATHPHFGPVFSNFSETTVSLPSNISSIATDLYPPRPSGSFVQPLQPSQMNFPPSVGAPPAFILSSSASTSSFPVHHNPSFPKEFNSADAPPRPSWTEVQPSIPATGTYPFQFASNAMPPRNEFHVQSNVRPMPSILDGVPTIRNYDINQSSYPSVAAHQFQNRPAGAYQAFPTDAMHQENHASFQQNAHSLPPLLPVNMTQGQFRVSPADGLQNSSLIFPNESGTSRPPGGDFHSLSNSITQPQRLMPGFQGSIGNMPSIHGLPSTLEPPFSKQSTGLPEYKQELLLSGVGMSKVTSTTYYNPFASTFEQTHREPRYRASFIPNRDSFNEHGQWAASSSGSRSGAFFASLPPGTTVLTSYKGTSYQGHNPDQSSAPTSGTLKHVNDVTAGKQYDPLSDSFDSLGMALRKHDNSQEKGVPAATVTGFENDILKNSGKLFENNQPKVTTRLVSNFDDEVGETATDTEAGAVENGSPLLDDGKDWNPEIPAGNTGPGAVEIEQQPSPGKNKRGKDSRSMKLFKIAIANFVKEILKPSWRQGNMSKEAFKTVVKKTVDKVAGAMPNHQVPKTQAKIDQYVESSQRKLTKLVTGYVEKYVKT